MKKIIGITSLILLVFFWISTPLVADPTWEYIYEGDILPDDTSLGDNAWQLEGDNRFAETTDQSELHIDDVGANHCFFLYNISDPALMQQATIEARVKVLSQSGSANFEVLVGMQDGSNSKWLDLFPDHILLNATSSTYDVDMTEYHILRMVRDTDDIHIYVDDVEVISEPHVGAGESWIGFIFGAGCTLCTSEQYWDYLVFTTEGGFSPEELPSYAHIRGTPDLAYGPVPADGSLHPNTWANLSWRAGLSAVTHDVYFSENFDDVNAGAESTFIGNQATTFLVVGFPGFPSPDGLIPSTTYYWRVDEVNDADPNSPWKGNVWSFSIPPKTAYIPNPADSAESVDVDVILSWTQGFGAKLHTVYFGETFDEVENAAGGSPQGAATFSLDTLKMAKTYYWRVDEFDIVETHKGDVWSFTTEGAVAALNPVNGAIDVTQTPVLTWAPGLGATHDVYFGTDAASLELKGSGNLGSESFEPGQLEWNTTYYWRVDEANSANADSPWTGPLWSFTTANFLIIDDMESYNDIDEGEPGSNKIYLVWVDGYDDPTNGSQVGYLDIPSYEDTIVHNGNKSMPLIYDNAVGKSEATLTLTDKRDWTVNGVNRLTIWFRGSSSNAAEQMYVALNDSAVVTNDNSDAALLSSWTEWNIDLQAFADQGVNLGNVNSITIGLDSVTGGTGTMYFDDIRLHPPTANVLPDSKWKLTWSDEFDGESIDLNKWTHMIGDGTDYGEQPGWGNNEKQFYTDDPANSGTIIDDEGNSALFIEAIMTNGGTPEYTSAKLTTESLFAFRFGKIEARIKLPFSQGIWPAFWMLGSNKPQVDWPGCGEIDIMEMLGGAEQTVYGNIHYVNSDNEHDEDLGFSILGEGKYSDDYHIYSIEWSPGNIKWLIDGEYFHEVEITADMKEFLRSHYLILNIAVGGYWPGYPDETSVFPQRMYVDYVRIYQDTTLTDIPDEPALDVDEETMGLGSASALAAINSDFTPFHNIKIVKYGPASPDISVSTVSIDGKTSISAVYSGGNWGGFWFELDSPIDMSEYLDGNLVVMLDVPENIADFEVKLESTGGFGSVNLLDYPSEAVDNNFEKFTIPLADFVTLGLKLESLTIPFALWNPKDTSGEYTEGNVLVDNIYFELSE